MGLLPSIVLDRGVMSMHDGIRRRGMKKDVKMAAEATAAAAVGGGEEVGVVTCSLSLSIEGAGGGRKEDPISNPPPLLGRDDLPFLDIRRVSFPWVEVCRFCELFFRGGGKPRK